MPWTGLPQYLCMTLQSGDSEAERSGGIVFDAKNESSQSNGATGAVQCRKRFFYQDILLFSLLQRGYCLHQKAVVIPTVDTTRNQNVNRKPLTKSPINKSSSST